LAIWLGSAVLLGPSTDIEIESGGKDMEEVAGLKILTDVSESIGKTITNTHVVTNDDGSLDKILFMFSGGSVMEIMTTTDYCENGIMKLRTLDSINQYSLFELKAISSDQMDEIIKFRREKVRQKIRDEQEAERIARRKYYEELKQEFEEGNGTSHDK